jgi:hypothetical protein
MAPTSQIDAYMTVARDLLQGVEVLSGLNNIHPRSCALIAAHSLECALKAFLCHKGKQKEIRQREIQHDLMALWDLSCKEGDLCIPESPPDWIKMLSSGHGPYYYFRYQVGENKAFVNAGSFPAMVPMAMGVKELLKKVDNIVKDK